MIWLALIGCPAPTPTPTETAVPTPPDLTVRLGPGEVRAGVITDPAALFGGVSAEGQPGDFKIYNDRVQFVIQGDRPGSYYVQVGGGVIDADIVRPEGQVGRDLVDELSAMLGFGRMLSPRSIEVVSDGTDGEAVIRVTGQDVPLALLRGALESPTLFPEQGLSAVTEYRLPADSWLMEVTTTVTSTTPVDGFAIGDILMGAPELADAWSSGTGLEPTSGPRAVSGYLGKRNDGAVAIVSQPGSPLQPGGAADLIAELADLVLGFQEAEDLAAESTRSWTRWYGVGPDLATLTTAAYGADQTLRTGSVTAPDGPVAGARVHVLVGTEPYTVAITGADGTYEASVPPGDVSFVADGRGRSMFTDLPDGYASWPAFSVDPVLERAASTYTAPSEASPVAQGRGLGAQTGLDEPGRVVVRVDDGLPFTVRVGSSAPDARDPRLAQRRPDGLAAAGWSRGSDLELLVEPGTWDLLVHRGLRYEIHTGDVTVTAGETTFVDATLPAAFEHPGYLAGDPHSHASPSGDGGVSMEERILVQAAGGVQLHFGSDHDRVADYRPLVTALGLDPVMRSVVADEVSSVLRGHMNAYPLEPDPLLPNNGAVHWWESIPETTNALVQSIRDRHGDIVIQANHPLDSGVGDSADWSPGTVRRDFWPTSLDAMEVLNDGGKYTSIYLDLLNRGTIVTPVGVSDSHTHFQATPGTNITWIGTGSDDVSTYSDATLVEAYRRHQTIAGLGVFLDMSIAPGSVLTAPQTLTVEARSPSWARVDRLKLLVDGVETEVVDGTSATFTLDAPADASFIVVAEGDDHMTPVTFEFPWAMSSAILLDRDGDGWDPPLPPLELR